MKNTDYNLDLQLELPTNEVTNLYNHKKERLQDIGGGVIDDFMNKKLLSTINKIYKKRNH